VQVDFAEQLHDSKRDSCDIRSSCAHLATPPRLPVSAYHGG
jgi:hypothetical protein